MTALSVHVGDARPGRYAVGCVGQGERSKRTGRTGQLVRGAFAAKIVGDADGAEEFRGPEDGLPPARREPMSATPGTAIDGPSLTGRERCKPVGGKGGAGDLGDACLLALFPGGIHTVRAVVGDQCGRFIGAHQAPCDLGDSDGLKG